MLAFEIFIPLVLFFILLGLRQKKPAMPVKEGRQSKHDTNRDVEGTDPTNQIHCAVKEYKQKPMDARFDGFKKLLDRQIERDEHAVLDLVSSVYSSDRSYLLS